MLFLLICASQKYYYRFRRIANRKNHTKRPMQLYKESDYEKSLSEMGLDRRQHIYLEQDTDPSKRNVLLSLTVLAFPGLDEFDDDKAFVSIRLWDPIAKRPTSIRDFVLPKSMTLRQIKEMLAEKYVSLKPEEMVIVEEETQKRFNPMDQDNDTLSKYG